MTTSPAAPPGELAGRRLALAFVAILLVGAALRLPAALRTPVFLWDDAVVHLEAVWLGDLARAGRAAVAAKLEERRTGADLVRVEEAVARFRREARGLPPSFGRPLHEVATLAMLETLRVVAPSRATSATAVLSALAGTLSLVLVYRLGRTLYGTWGGLAAMALTAVTGTQVLYAREGLSESLLVLVLWLALDFALASRAHAGARGRAAFRGTVRTGLVLGLGLLVHPRFVLLAAIVVASDLVATCRLRGRVASATAWGRALRMGAAVLAPPACAELPYYLVLLAADARGLDVRVATYLEQVAWVLLPQGLGYAGSLVRFRPENLLTYPLALCALSGVVLTAGTALSVVDVARRPWRGAAVRGAGGAPPPPLEGTLVALAVLPLLFYSLTVPLLRYGATSFAIAPLLFARLVARQARGRGPAARHVAAVLAGLALTEGLVWTALSVDTRGGYAGALVDLARYDRLETGEALDPALLGRLLAGEADPTTVVTGDGGRVAIPAHVATMVPVSWVLAGRERAAPVPASAAELRRLVAAGKRYLLVDSLVDFLVAGGVGFPAQQELLRRIEARCEPVVRAPNPAGATLVHDLELNYRPLLETLREYRRAAEREADVIRGYDLRRCTSWASG